MKRTINLPTVLVVAALLIAGGFWLFGGDDAPKVEPRAITAASGVKIIAFGDSLTAGYGLPASEGYPALLEADLKQRGHLVSVINSGVSGETTRGNLERAQFIRNQNPDIVILGIGGNDALRLLPVEETRSNIEKTITILKSGENPPVVVLLGMQAPINVGLGYKRTFDALYEELAEEKELLLVPFITAEVFLDNANKLSDGIHYNKQGYQKIIELYLGEPISDIVTEMTS